MSSPYQVLDNRPLDQWKVTELKEELRKRRLTIGGLKQDLVKRLDEAVRSEREEAAKEAIESFDSDEPSAVDSAKDAEPVEPDIAQAPIAHGDNGSERVQIDINDSGMDVEQGEAEKVDMGTGANSADKEEDSAVCDVAICVTETKSTSVNVTVSQQELPPVEVKSVNENSESQLDNDVSKSEPMNEGLKPHVAEEETKGQRVSFPVATNQVSDVSPNQGFQGSSVNEKSESRLENDDSKSEPVNEDLKPQAANKETERDLPAANNQVSVVSPIQGFQVSSDFHSNDSVSINEKIGLKDNIIADNAKLEFDLGKPEMVEPSSSHVVPDGGESHPMDVEEPHNNTLSVEEQNDDRIAANAEMNMNNVNEDMGYPEKLNLDRSSGDDSIEEDVQEGKQVDSNYDSGDGVDRSEKNEIHVEKEESLVDIVGDSSPANEKDIGIEENNRVEAEKRKLNELEAARNNEPVKRQRKWNAENKVSELQGSSGTSATALKDTFPVAAPKPNFSRSNSKTSDDSPKERIVPPSQKPATNSLRIDNFVRPFTLKAVQELLGKTGTVTSFWMDHIKTHCYITYSSVEEATATRDAVYNLRWPPYGGQLLAAEFVDSMEVKLRVDPPSQAPAAAPISTGTSVPQVPPSQPQPSPRQKVSKQQATPTHALPPPPPLSNPLIVRERINIPPPPPPSEKVDPPIVTLDDLFRKTKATPRIYYLPLSEEQVAAKLKARDRSTKP